MRPNRIAILLIIILLTAVPATAFIVPAPAGHTVTFLNTCSKPVWINLQGGPKGVCDGVIDPDTHQLKKCSACSLCDGGGLCNTSAATGDSKPLCCPGIRQDLLYCWNKANQCQAGGCCPGIPQTANTAYNCPGAHETTGCQNTTMTQAQIDALSGYNNPANGLSHLVCNGSLISNGGFRLDASTGTRTFTFERGWQGAFYPRTNCTFVNGIGSCETGNCKDPNGKGLLECGGAGSTAPVTKGEFNLDDAIDWYDVSWVDGFNVAMVIEPLDHDLNFPASDPSHHCTTAGCSVGLQDFRSPAVPDWNVLKYPGVSSVAGILSDCNLYSSYQDTGSPLYVSEDIKNGYCCPISEGYVNDSSISCVDVPAGKTCKTCAGQNNNLYPFNRADALPNSAKLFYNTCPKAYAYTYNDTDALMTCQGNSTRATSYRITISCPGPVLKSLPPATLLPDPGSSSGEEPAAAALLSPGSDDGDTMDFIFNDFSEASGSSAVSDTTIHHVHITPVNDTGESVVRVVRNPDPGTVPDLSGHSFAFYYRIESPGLPSAQIGSATIEFSVKESYLASLGLKPADIVLEHWDGSRWVELPTVYSFSSNGRAYFASTTPGFSLFAITSRGSPVAPAATGTTLPLTLPPSLSSTKEMPGTVVTTVPAFHGTTAPEVPGTPAESRNQSPASPPAAGTAPGLPVLAVIILAALCCIAAGGWYARRWYLRRQNPSLFREYD